MTNQKAGEYVLGVDLGSNSLGWAIVNLVDGEPAGLLHAGARVFDAGMEGDVESGREESRNLKRRQMRLQRRQTWRRARRLKKIFNLLQRYGLLPSGDASTPEKRQDLLNDLDKDIRASDWFKAKAASGEFPEPNQTLPYILRAAALDEKLEPRFLGRALYHLAQRRGFLSNRKQAAKKKDDDEGAVKEGIAELRKAIGEKSARTLGEYFSRLSPCEQRIRSRWTARDMYEQEFNLVWDAQAKYHPGLLTREHEKELFKAIFFQRPLWFDPNTIGRCELEPGERRAPVHLLVSQRFRLLQAVNNLRLLPPGEPERPLTPADRKKLIDELETKGDLTFRKVRSKKVLDLGDDYAFTVERGGEKTLRGNRTNAELSKVFGERWLAMSGEERDRAVEYVHAFQKPGKLKEAARKHFQLDDKAAEKLSEISLEPDYLSLSRKAIERLLPKLEEGYAFMEARKQVYPESFKSGDSKLLLPPVELALAEIRNPAVMRSLTELRKVVNAVVRQHGKPTQIRIELARDLKKSKKQRVEISENNRRNEKSRAEAAKKIMADAGIKEPKPDDIRRFLLAEECHWVCPYSGMSISMQSLFGPEPQFDIEHIIPFSRSMDNSFQNLTLCYVPENRNVKGNKTPHQAYSGDPQRYEAILDRVKKFTGERAMVSAKLKRFMMNDDELEIFLEDFRKRQLNDTAYATSLAAKYLGLLYGGVNDAAGKRRVQATSGRTTSYFRNLWKLNSVLNDGPTTDGGYKPKSRDDHRHHAIDAVVIGLTDAGMIKRLSDAAQRAPEVGRKRFAPLEGPWPNFVDSVRAEIDKIVVSHRVSKKVSGALHEETIYSRPFPVAAVCDRRPRSRKNGGEDPPAQAGAAATVVRVRKPLAALTKNEVEDIADAGVKALVVAKLNGGDPKKVFASQENLPFFETSDGRRIPIKRVRINNAEKPMVLGQGRTQRHVISGNNHHVEIYAELGRDGSEKEWGGEVVSMFEAHQRLKAGKPVVQRDHGPLVKFKFSLAPGEVIECDDGNSGRALWVMRGVASYEAGPRLLLAPLRDARKKRDMLKARTFWSPFINPLRKLSPRKVAVSPLGEVSESHE
jgi:CRISPR-associated endonuclease Csn1